MFFFHKGNLFDFTLVCFSLFRVFLFAAEILSFSFFLLIKFHNFVLRFYISLLKTYKGVIFAVSLSFYFSITLFPFTLNDTFLIFSINSNISETSLYFIISIVKRNSFNSGDE